jgi:hypothetical protein
MKSASKIIQCLGSRIPAPIQKMHEWSAMLNITAPLYIHNFYSCATVSPGIEPGGIVFPSQNIIYIRLSVLQTMCELEILAVRRVSFENPSRVSC